MASFRKSNDIVKDEDINIGDYVISFDKVKKEENLKIVFMGTPSFAVPILRGLIENYSVIMLVSQPDKKKDRHGKLLPTDTKKLALEYNIPVFQPKSIKDDYQKVLDVKPDMIITCAYGQFIPKEIINYPKYGCINVHGSLLPKYRGGAPIHWALINGDKITGITIMKTTLKMDAGDIIKQKSTYIEDDENLESLYNRLSYLGKELLLEVIPTIIENKATYLKQNEEEVTYALNITKEQLKIDFNNSATNIVNQIRGLSPVPGAYCYLDNSRIKIYQAKISNYSKKGIPGEIINITQDTITVVCKDKAIDIIELHQEGKKRCLVSSYLNGLQGKSLIGKVLK